jgi:predicted RND superfamily exporter protein
MIASSLTPYITVGVFIMTMMMLSAIFTLIYLPALVVLFASKSRSGVARQRTGNL